MKTEIQSSFHALLIISLSFSLSLSTSAQTCRNYRFSSNEVFSSCLDHSVLNSALHWTYLQSNSTLKVAFRRPETAPARWIAWAINPQGLFMAGSQAFVAHLNSTGIPYVYTSDITSTAISELEEGPITFEVVELSASYMKNEMIIFATIRLPNGLTRINQVWQEGPLSVPGGFPLSHSLTGDHMRSLSTLDLLSG